MRTLGPRSISSVLKILLDIVFALLCISAVAIGFQAMFSAAALAHPQAFAHWTWPGSHYPILAATPRAAARLLIFASNVLGMIVVVWMLRKIFVTLVAGKPFELENARRLRVIGLALVAVEVADHLIHAILWGWPSGRRLFDEINFTGWFAIAVLFVLAEVFEEGARLRREAELTI